MGGVAFRRPFAAGLFVAAAGLVVVACVGGGEDGTDAAPGTPAAGDSARKTAMAASLDPAELRQAKQIYDAHTCALCHGASAEGGADGPPLRGLDDWWTREMLVDYMVDPEGFVEINKNFADRRDAEYAMAMPAYDYVDREDLELLARWMLSRPAAGETPGDG